jgi:hypothetical protein
MNYSFSVPWPAFVIFLLRICSLVNSSPQGGGWDKATGRDHVGKRPIPSSGSIQSTKSLTGENAPLQSPPPPHFRDLRHRAICDLTLDDERVCPTGEACVTDPFRSADVKRNSDGSPLGVCTSSISSNMCGGFVGAAWKCSNDMNGWRYAEPGRCKRETISNCDWLCVRPPANSQVEGMGFDKRL